MVSDRVIEKWVKIINKRFGREDRNDFSIEYFKKIRALPGVNMESHRGWYLVTITTTDMWGDTYLNLLSCGVMPDKNAGLNFLKIQRRIKDIAKRKKIKYTVQGSSIVGGYNKLLSKMGYEVCDLRKENK